MKYIVFRLTKAGDSHGLEIPIVFPDILVHLYVAEHLKSMLSMQYPHHEATVVSAGDVSSMAFQGEIFSGRSTTLGIGSRHKQDAELFAMCDYGGAHVFVGEPDPQIKKEAMARGGKARAASLSPERRSEIARKAALTRHDKNRRGEGKKP